MTNKMLLRILFDSFNLTDAQFSELQRLLTYAAEEYKRGEDGAYNNHVQLIADLCRTALTNK